MSAFKQALDLQKKEKKQQDAIRNQVSNIWIKQVISILRILTIRVFRPVREGFGPKIQDNRAHRSKKNNLIFLHCPTTSGQAHHVLSHVLVEQTGLTKTMLGLGDAEGPNQPPPKQGQIDYSRIDTIHPWENSASGGLEKYNPCVTSVFTPPIFQVRCSPSTHHRAPEPRRARDILRRGRLQQAVLADLVLFRGRLSPLLGEASELPSVARLGLRASRARRATGRSRTLLRGGVGKGGVGGGGGRGVILAASNEAEEEQAAVAAEEDRTRR